jgi:uncharacterized RDD family membrane protein YckC
LKLERSGVHPPVNVFPAGAAERQGLRAGVVSRVAAMIIDAVVVAASTVVLFVAGAGIRFLWHRRSFTWPHISFAEFVTVAAVASVVYLTSGWASTGRTVGKRFAGLRVVNYQGTRMRWVGAFLRAMVCTFFPIGLLWCAVSRHNRSVQDVLLRTSVIYDWHSRVVP